MKWTICFLTALTLGFADTSDSEANPPPQWDSDLFQRDHQVVSNHLEFLYWQPTTGGLSYAETMSNPLPNGTSYAIGKYNNTKYNADPGFRLALSFFRAPRYWEVWWMYTHLNASGENRATPPSGSGEFLIPTWGNNLSTLSGAKSSVHLNYNVADFFVDRFFNPNPHLRIRLIGGLAAVWLNQNWSIHYNDINAKTSFVRSNWAFSGAGMRLGLMTDWYWLSHVYITAKTTFAAIMGNYENHSYQTDFTQTTPIRNAKYEDSRAITNLQFLIGPSWQKNVCKNRMEFFAGYELNIWLNLQEVYRSTGGTASGAREPWVISSSLGLQGLTARFTFDY